MIVCTTRCRLSVSLLISIRQPTFSCITSVYLMKLKMVVLYETNVICQIKLNLSILMVKFNAQWEQQEQKYLPRNNYLHSFRRTFVLDTILVSISVDPCYFFTPDTDKEPHLYYRINTLSPGSPTMRIQVQSVQEVINVVGYPYGMVQYNTTENSLDKM